MPIVQSAYKPPFLFRQTDIATIYSGKIRRISGITQKRERLELPDGDFLDVDWSYSSQKTNRCIVILHGLEGSAQRPYVLGTAKLFNQNGFDTCAMNFRGCSGEDNRLLSTYHSGKSSDLEEVVKHVIELGYTEIVIKGFSMGGNISLFYAGTHQLPEEVKTIVAVSTPCDLKGSSEKLHQRRNWIYAQRFLITLKKKVREKFKQFPDKMIISEINSVKTLKDFDDLYTSKLNGFADAADYYEKCSSLAVLSRIGKPTLILNAQNDSFLSRSCFPYEIAEKTPHFYLETPQYGGHVAFYDSENVYYNEKRALQFCTEIMNKNKL
ncbi:YheT family hydrolase [Capnocytophaga felis]|uniref:Alpha/beta hydrolase n=1 Tax=Capnocytophaga felis TaxID=2267611 RepID=A0A5M4BBD3_9FLAO|nr:alpha/beta fold hydrolase [Capnocytophaga felis]GET46547.1 alpha/beta hydrolase [Capnocytophaga felis]GET49021.1 alpha/beta hydrolase [Capnocytophaga felis]